MTIFCNCFYLPNFFLFYEKFDVGVLVSTKWISALEALERKIESVLEKNENRSYCRWLLEIWMGALGQKHNKNLTPNIRGEFSSSLATWRKRPNSKVRQFDKIWAFFWSNSCGFVFVERLNWDQRYHVPIRRGGTFFFKSILI